MQRYRVMCKKCKAIREVGIVRGAYQEIIDWLDNHPDPQFVKIISARKRFDNQWGFECVCGNNDLWTKQEAEYVQNRAAPKPQEIAEIVNKMIPQQPQFTMEKS